jgi:hypothetical protein
MSLTMSLMSVDLPAPLGPVTATREDSERRQVMSLRM